MTVVFFTLNNKVTKKTSFFIIKSMLFVSLCVILATYMTIRKRLRNTNPAVEAHNRKTIEQNVKLSKTLFVVRLVVRLLASSDNDVHSHGFVR